MRYIIVVLQGSKYSSDLAYLFISTENDYKFLFNVTWSASSTKNENYEKLALFIFTTYLG